MNKQPSIKQMRNRMHAGHRVVLEAVRDGRKLNPLTAGEARGDRTSWLTLRRWRAISDDGYITTIGHQLLAPPEQDERTFRGVGHLERSGYIPAGSAAEREQNGARL